MRAPFVRSWAAESLTAELVPEATPPANVALLAQAVMWPESVAVTPYAGCAHMMDAASTTALEGRHLAAVVAPGASHARATLTRSWQPQASSASTPYHELWSTSGGASGADVLRITWYVMPGSGWIPDPLWTGAAQHLVDSGSSVVDSPASGHLDRQLELASLGYPYVEPLYATLVTGFSVSTSMLVEDLELL